MSWPVLAAAHLRSPAYPDNRIALDGTNPVNDGEIHSIAKIANLFCA
jgi:hypothetical protein